MDRSYARSSQPGGKGVDKGGEGGKGGKGGRGGKGARSGQGGQGGEGGEGARARGEMCDLVGRDLEVARSHNRCDLQLCTAITLSYPYP